jgi:hypothetical protein
MKILFLAFCLAAFSASSSQMWLMGVQRRERLVVTKVENLRASLLKNGSEKNRAAVLKKLAPLKKEVAALDGLIKEKSDAKFEEGASDAWKSVVQQARGLQDLSEESVIDLENQAKGKQK